MYPHMLQGVLNGRKMCLCSLQYCNFKSSCQIFLVLMNVGQYRPIVYTTSKGRSFASISLPTVKRLQLSVPLVYST